MKRLLHCGSLFCNRRNMIGNFKVVRNDVRISAALQARSHCQRLVVVHKMLKNSI